MEYKEILKERFELLKKKYLENGKNLKNKYGIGEFKALGGASCILYIKYKFKDTESFYEDAIEKLEAAILKQDKIFESKNVSGWNSNFDTKLIGAFR